MLPNLFPLGQDSSFSISHKESDFRGVNPACIALLNSEMQMVSKSTSLCQLLWELKKSTKIKCLEGLDTVYFLRCNFSLYYVINRYLSCIGSVLGLELHPPSPTPQIWKGRQKFFGHTHTFAWKVCVIRSVHNDQVHYGAS
jgi:hypothetical protein